MVVQAFKVQSAHKGSSILVHFPTHLSIITITMQRRAEKEGRVSIAKMELWKKVFYAITVSLICFSLNRGNPGGASLTELTITDEKIEYIYETTMAVQTKKIRKRITEESNGFWRAIEPYVSLTKWAEIEVELKTRIGIRLNSLFYDRLHNNIHLSFGEPCVLDRSYTARVVSSSDTFFSKWSIEQFQERKYLFLTDLVEQQSNELVSIFKSDSQQVAQLEGEYQNKILSSLSHNYHALAPLILVWRLNNYVLSLLQPVLPAFANNTYYYTKQIEQPPQLKLAYKSQQSKKPADNKHNKTGREERDNTKEQANGRFQRKQESMHTQQQQKRRERIKRKLQL